MGPKAVFFDFGGTLVATTPELEEPWRAWSKVIRQFGLDIGESTLRETNREADRIFHPRIYDFHGRTREYWRLHDTWMIDRLGVTAHHREMFEAVQAVFEDSSLVHPFPETAEVLKSLRSRGVHVGVISNFTDQLLVLLQRHGLRDYFDSVTYSQEAGADKPDPRIFALALSRAGRRPDEAVHVGDSWESDYLGAKRSGMTPVLVNRGRHAPLESGLEIPDLRPLPDLLGKV